MKDILVVFALLMIAINGQALDQTIISNESIASQFFGNDVSADGDWIGIGTAINKVHFMKWNGTHYDDSARQVFTGDSWFGTRVTMKNGWAFVSGKAGETQVYKRNVGNTAYEHHSTIPYGSEFNRYPDTWNAQNRAVDITDDGTKIIIFDDAFNTYRIYVESGGTWTQSGNSPQVGFKPFSCGISGDGTRAILCAAVQCNVFNVATESIIIQLTKSYLGPPYSSYVATPGYSAELNYDGSVIAVQQNSVSQGAGAVHFLEETSPNTWTIAYTMIDNDGWGGATYDLLGTGIEYIAEKDIWLVNDALHSITGNYRKGAVYVVRKNPSGVWETESELTAWTVFPDGSTSSWHDKGWAMGGMAYNNGKLITATQKWAVPEYQNSNDGRIDTIDLAITPYPTPQPTLAPTQSPTPNPIVEVGTVDVTMSFTNSTKSGQAATDLIAELKGSYTQTEYRVQSTDSFNIPFTGQSDETIIAAIKTARNLQECNVTLSSAGRRLDSRELDTTINVEIFYDLDETAFNTLQSTGNNLESETFLNSLASSLGVNPSNLTVTVVDSQVIVEVTLLATSSETEPLDAATVQQLQNLQTSASTSSSTIVSEIGGGTASVSTVDLCADRTCSGYGIYEAGVTTATGCVIETGVCQCSNNKWGINCETDCTCENGGTCVNSYCMCDYPYHGVRCQLDKTTDCTACFA